MFLPLSQSLERTNLSVRNGFDIFNDKFLIHRNHISVCGVPCPPSVLLQASLFSVANTPKGFIARCFEFDRRLSLKRVQLLHNFDHFLSAESLVVTDRTQGDTSPVFILSAREWVSVRPISLYVFPTEYLGALFFSVSR